MSSPSTTATDALPRNVRLPAGLARPLEALGFWAAVALPFLYVPLLVTGVADRASQVAALLLIGLHVAALVVGHRHHADD